MWFFFDLTFQTIKIVSELFEYFIYITNIYENSQNYFEVLEDWILNLQKIFLHTLIFY